MWERSVYKCNLILLPKALTLTLLRDLSVPIPVDLQYILNGTTASGVVSPFHCHYFGILVPLLFQSLEERSGFPNNELIVWRTIWLEEEISVERHTASCTMVERTFHSTSRDVLKVWRRLAGPAVKRPMGRQTDSGSFRGGSAFESHCVI